MAGNSICGLIDLRELTAPAVSSFKKGVKMNFVKKLTALLFLNFPTVILVSLKLSGSIDWNWWAVTVFLWLPVAFLAVLFSFMLILMLTGVAAAGSIFAAVFGGLKKAIAKEGKPISDDDGSASDAEYVEVG